MGIWRGIKIGLTIVGTSIGAGFASGREIWEFFASYGQASQYSLWMAMILFTFIVFVVLWMSAETETTNYYSILSRLMGHRLASLFDVLTLLYLLSMTVVMFAGSGATFSEWNLSYKWGVWVIAVAVFVVLLFNAEGLMSIQSLVIPVMVGVLIYVCVHFLTGVEVAAQPVLSDGPPPWPSGIVYTALNVVSLIAVISTLGKEIKSKIELFVAAGLSTLGLGVISVLLNESLLKMGDKTASIEIPLFAMLNQSSTAMFALASVILWLAIYTTALGGVYGIVSRIAPFFSTPSWQISLLLILLMIPLSQFGFSKLVAILYPLYGVLNLFVMALLILYPISKGLFEE